MADQKSCFGCVEFKMFIRIASRCRQLNESGVQVKHWGCGYKYGSLQLINSI